MEQENRGCYSLISCDLLSDYIHKTCRKALQSLFLYLSLYLHEDSLRKDLLSPSNTTKHAYFTLKSPVQMSRSITYLHSQCTSPLYTHTSSPFSSSV